MEIPIEALCLANYSLQQNNKELELFSTEALKGLQKQWGPLWLMLNKETTPLKIKADLWEQALSVQLDQKLVGD